MLYICVRLWYLIGLLIGVLVLCVLIILIVLGCMFVVVNVVWYMVIWVFLDGMVSVFVWLF